MKKFLAVLGRQPLISVAELESLYQNVKLVAPNLATFETDLGAKDLVFRLGGTLKIAEPVVLPQFWQTLPDEGKITLGVSDYSKKSSPFLAQKEALHWKRFLAKQGRSVRVIPNKTVALSSATSIHNHLFTPTHIEAYAGRDRARPARDAKVGMLPPKLAQVLINLCGNLPAEARLLDPFCGTGVVLQEGALMGYIPYGTDVSERMVDYSRRNLEWLEGLDQGFCKVSPQLLQKSLVEQGDATSFQWSAPIDAVACETYLGPPMSQPPAEIKLKQAKQECKSIIVGFLKNLSGQLQSGTPVVIAVPAWLRPDGHYERLNLLDEIDNLRYNVVRFKNMGQKDFLYHRDGQVVAREIIVLRKK